MYKNLEKQEFKVLCKIAKRTGMDCWFYIVQNKNGDYIFDLEENKKISLKKAITQLTDGLAYPLSHEGITSEERDVFIKLLQKLKIPQEGII